MIILVRRGLDCYGLDVSLDRVVLLLLLLFHQQHFIEHWLGRAALAHYDERDQQREGRSGHSGSDSGANHRARVPWARVIALVEALDGSTIENDSLSYVYGAWSGLA